MNNLNLYNKVRKVPTEAKKEIAAGRLKGKTDINPMWRIKTLTENFGACGFGWYYEITKQWLETGGNTNEVAAFVNINLYVKIGEDWSKPIFGTGGSSFVANERNGLYVSDECFKMALTDAISVACKALGVGADVYWGSDATKNDLNQGRVNSEPQPSEKAKVVLDLLLSDNELCQKTLGYFNVGDVTDLSDKNLALIYDTRKQKGLIK